MRKERVECSCIMQDEVFWRKREFGGLKVEAEGFMGGVGGEAELSKYISVGAGWG